MRYASQSWIRFVLACLGMTGACLVLLHFGFSLPLVFAVPASVLLGALLGWISGAPTLLAFDENSLTQRQGPVVRTIVFSQIEWMELEGRYKSTPVICVRSAVGEIDVDVIKRSLAFRQGLGTAIARSDPRILSRCPDEVRTALGQGEGLG